MNGTTTYFAIAGSANSLEPDQLKLAITAANAELGDSITFANAGTGRQQLLTTSFGATATQMLLLLPSLKVNLYIKVIVLRLQLRLVMYPQTKVGRLVLES